MDVLLWEDMNYDRRPSSVKCVDFHSYEDVIRWSAVLMAPFAGFHL